MPSWTPESLPPPAGPVSCPPETQLGFPPPGAAVSSFPIGDLPLDGLVNNLGPRVLSLSQLRAPLLPSLDPRHVLKLPSKNSFLHLPRKTTNHTCKSGIEHLSGHQALEEVPVGREQGVPMGGASETTWQPQSSRGPVNALHSPVSV